MKYYNYNEKIIQKGLFVLSIFTPPAFIILCTHLLYGYNHADLKIITNTALTRRICSTHHKILYGIFTMPHKVETRTVARHQKQCGFNNKLHQMIFVVGMPKTDKDYEIIMRESKQYKDIFVLTCKENMNEGKSYTYFKEALEQLPCFDFYAKVDDDTAFHPTKLWNKIATIPNNGPLYIGRSPESEDTNILRLIQLTLRFNLRDMSWIYNVDKYNAGMLYILNSQAVKSWVDSNPIGIYGDEDYRTSYYMIKIGAKNIDLKEKFHDYIKYNALFGHWKLDITNNSLAVHQCKSTRDLLDAFKLVCATYAA